MAIFLASIAAMGSLFHQLRHLFRKPKYRAVFIWMLIILLLGTVFYHFAEGWSWLDSFYFSVITLSTVGYGDFSPTTAIAKIFTSAYIFLGISIFVSFASMLAKERLEIEKERHSIKQQKSEE